MVIRTCKWYQTVRLVMTRQLVPSVTFLGQILKLTYLGHYVPCYLLWPLVPQYWPNKKVLYKSCRSYNELKLRLPFVATIRGFRDLTVRRPKRPPHDSEPFRARVRKRVNQRPPWGRSIKNNARQWGLILTPLLSPKPLGRFSKFKRRMTALPKLSRET